MMNWSSDFWGGLLIGIAIFWGILAIFSNKALIKYFPGLLEWAPFLDPAGGHRSEAQELTSRFISGHTFNILDVVRDAKIINRHFEDCDIYGPAVLSIAGVSQITNCSFDGTIDAFFILIDQEKAIGPLTAQDCIFKRCRFHGIGFIGGMAARDKFLQAIQQSASGTPHSLPPTSS